MKKIIFSIILTPLLASGFLSCSSNKKERVLPILGNYDVEYRQENGKEVADTIYPKVPSFRYLNQDSTWITKDTYKGKVLIVDFMFTHCPSICPSMTSNMKSLAEATQDLKDKVQFISFTIDPSRDTPSRFKEYIKERGIGNANWDFLTGQSELKTYDLALQYFHVGAQRSDNPEEEFLHDDKFVLVDPNGYVRGIYEGTQKAQVDVLEEDLRKLIKYELTEK